MSLTPLSPLQDVWNAALRCPSEIFVNIQFRDLGSARRYRARLYGLRDRVQRINRKTVPPQDPNWGRSTWDHLGMYITKDYVLVIGNQLHLPTEITIGPAHKN